MSPKIPKIPITETYTYLLNVYHLIDCIIRITLSNDYI